MEGKYIEILTSKCSLLKLSNLGCHRYKNPPFCHTLEDLAQGIKLMYSTVQGSDHGSVFLVVFFRLTMKLHVVLELLFFKQNIILNQRLVLHPK